jgi:hypothetical protein
MEQQKHSTAELSVDTKHLEKKEKKKSQPSDILVGSVHTSNNYGDFIIKKYNNAVSVEIEFISTGFNTMARAEYVRKGRVRDPLYPSMYGVGFIGVGKHETTLNRKRTKHCKTWINMFKRCCSESYHESNQEYIGCSVHPDWHNFQNFAKWFDDNYIDGYQLDKDILIKGNKVYSPDTCRMIPKSLNTLLTDCAATRGDYPQGVCQHQGGFVAQLSKRGVRFYIGCFNTPELAYEAYKSAKEQHVKDEALRYFESGEIQQDIYDSLMKWDLL